ncbi:AAA family ATPase [Chitinophaga sp. ysch24]|uniref:AAA family ATPase n=2 Tax=Chitinophaga tropicalis TaxID=2683588 RepID=A0A7K1TXB4_9BACT|nr:AAA family ATPase [Chitinophaga tropicalis]
MIFSKPSFNMYIITGGPGSGKSTLINALTERGIQCMPEAGRAIIQDQQAIGGPALPWVDPGSFAELMLSWDIRSYREGLKLQGPVIFDRGIPDVMGYLRLNSLPVPPHIEKATQVFRYHPQIFIAPPWQEIFAQDNERKQSFEEAIATYHAMVKVYSGLNYEICYLPLSSVEERVEFIMQRIISSS